MKIAIIDLGTNSVRFDVHQVGAGGAPKCIFSDKLMVRLGRDLFRDDTITPEAVARAVVPLKEYRRVIDQLQVDRVVAVGTAALRRAKNGNAVVATILRETGIQFKIISGVEEAQLIGLGVLSNERELPDTIALVDIGGGSTEVSIVAHGDIVLSKSFPVGAAQLQQVFLQSSPPTPEAIEALRLHVRIQLEQEFSGTPLPARLFLVGSSGSIRAVAGLRREQGEDTANFSLRYLSDVVTEMSPKNRGELLQIPGMEESRLDIVLAGSLLLEELMVFLRATDGRTTKFSLRHGLLAREVQQLQAEPFV